MVKSIGRALCLMATPVMAESPYVAGAMGGVSTLSAEASSSISGRSAALSQYQPDNGPLVQVFGGIHLRDYLSVESNWTWNRNDLAITYLDATATYYRQGRNSRQHSLAADLLVYFRQRESWVRPFLSVGGGVVWFESHARPTMEVRGSPALPPAGVRSSGPALRVAVGMDVVVRRGWFVRYSFCETMSRNPIGAVLTPPGGRNLANFQNLFGVGKSF